MPQILSLHLLRHIALAIVISEIKHPVPSTGSIRCYSWKHQTPYMYLLSTSIKRVHRHIKRRYDTSAHPSFQVFIANTETFDSEADTMAPLRPELKRPKDFNYPTSRILKTIARFSNAADLPKNDGTNYSRCSCVI